MPINDKQEAFCQNYCNNGFNASQAYKAVYHAKAGWDKLSSRLMVKDDIKQRIAEIKTEKEAVRLTECEKIDKDFDNYQSECKRDKRWTEAIRCLENRAKHRGYYAEDNAQKAEQSRLTEDQLKDLEEFKAWKRRQYLRTG